MRKTRKNLGKGFRKLVGAGHTGPNGRRGPRLRRGTPPSLQGDVLMH